MKISIWWLLAIPVLIAGIASSQSGLAQKALKNYIERNCSFTLTTAEIEHAKANSMPAYVNVNCWAEESHEQK